MLLSCSETFGDGSKTKTLWLNFYYTEKKQEEAQSCTEKMLLGEIIGLMGQLGPLGKIDDGKCKNVK